MDKVDCIIIGAGVVGLAIAHTLGHKNREIILVERHEHFGKETSSRNSEVIHAGIYYPGESLKAELCVKGRHWLYEFCENHHVPCKKIGKLIIALCKEDEPHIHGLYKKGKVNGVDDLVFVDRKKIKELEPSIDAEYGIYSPSTGILDTHVLMKKLEASAEEKGVMCAYGCVVKNIQYTGKDFIVDVVDVDNKNMQIQADIVINCAGLESDTIAQMAGIDIDKQKYRIHLSKGEYFKINGKPSWFMNHLVYPPPGTTSLGIHTVLDLQGQLKLGPSAFYVNTIDYDVEKEHAADFFKAVTTFLPFLKERDLTPDMAGIRPKRQAKGEDFADFVITDEKEKGLPGLINLIGIESPGLTSCLSIAHRVETIYNKI